MFHQYKDPYAPPLGPKLPVDKPKWWPSWKEYNGRPEWKSELGYFDPDIRRGLNLGLTHPVRERDLRWMDPKVPDGTSVIGPLGLDSNYHRDLTRKYDAIGNFYDYQKMVRENSSQYKQIANKWDISKEHPGLAVNPTLDKIFKYSPEMLGASGVWPNTQKFYKHYWGPRFWDKPMNEGCFEKGLALAKYSVPLTIVYSIVNARGGRGGGVYFEELFKNWIKHRVLLPMTYSFLFGLTSCTSATIRDQDDTFNWIAGSVITGLAHATIRNNNVQGFTLALVGSLLGTLFQFFRIHVHGLSGMPSNKMHGGMHHAGPLNWKYFGVDDLNTAIVGYTPDRAPNKI